MDKYQNKYRIASARAQWWDYGWNGAYFVTICTANRECFMGKIAKGVMRLSPVGVIAYVMWQEIKNHAKNIELGDFVVMPNHIHGILIMDKPDGDFENNSDTNDTDTDGSGIGIIETRHALSLPTPTPPTPPPPTIGQKRFQNQGINTISSIVGGYKSSVTKYAHRLGYAFGWQARFHDHIIRNDGEYQRISNYIINNPSNWAADKFNDQ